MSLQCQLDVLTRCRDNEVLPESTSPTTETNRPTMSQQDTTPSHPASAAPSDASQRRLKTWFIVARTHHAVCVAFDRSLKEIGITSAQHELLANLLAVAPGGLSQKRLAELLFVTKGNITGLVKRLEERDLITRQEDPEDRRKNIVTLTQEGAKLARASCEKQQELVDAIFGPFEGTDDRQLRDLMKLLREGIRSYEALLSE